MYSLAKKLAGLKPYDPITGQYRIRLDANENFIKPSENILINALENVNLNRYPDPYAVKTVTAFSELYGVNPAHVTAGNGSDELISLITSCFLDKGDKILCLSSDFSMYYFYPKLYELDLYVLEKEDDFSVNIDKIIKAAADDNVRCVIFSNPCNPTSLGISSFEIKRLLGSTNALVVIDEAYMEFWDSKQSLLNETENYENLIVLKTCSKAIALAGIRLGFSVANCNLTNALKAAKSPYNTNSITQEIGYLTLSDKEQIKKNIEAVKESIKKLYIDIKNAEFPFFKKIYKPCTNFLFIETENAVCVYNFLLEQGIAVRLTENNLRITCGTEYENSELVRVLKNYTN